MTTKTRLSEEEVFDAANDLKEQGIIPTVLAIHKNVGSGSYTTVRKYLNLWEDKEKSSNNSVIQEKAQIPAEFATIAEGFINKVWHQAKIEADSDIAKEREALEAIKLDMQSQVTEASEFAEEMDIQRAEAEKFLKEASDNLKKSEDLNTTLNSEISHLNENNKALTEHTEQQAETEKEFISVKAKITAEVEQLKIKNKELFADNEFLKTDNRKIDRANAKLDANLKSVTDNFSEAKKELASSWEALKLETENKTVAETKLESALVEIEKLKQDKIELVDLNSQHEIQIKNLEIKLESALAEEKKKQTKNKKV